MKKILVFLDESGDLSLTKINPEFPVFGLVGVVVKPKDYPAILNKFNQLKLDYFVHEGLILHSRDIASREGDYIFLHNTKVRKSFLSDVSKTISGTSFKLVAAVIKKKELKKRYVDPASPYDLAFIFVLEKVFRYSCNEGYDYIHIITEARGREEDEELHRTFEHFKRKDKPGTARAFPRYINESMLDKIHLRLEFRRKPFNIIGNQIADLVVTPITRTILDGKDHPSFKYFEDKFLYGRSSSLKIFP